MFIWGQCIFYYFLVYFHDMGSSWTLTEIIGVSKLILQLNLLFILFQNRTIILWVVSYKQQMEKTFASRWYTLLLYALLWSWFLRSGPQWLQRRTQNFPVPNNWCNWFCNIYIYSYIILFSFQARYGSTKQQYRSTPGKYSYIQWNILISYYNNLNSFQNNSFNKV